MTHHSSTVRNARSATALKGFVAALALVLLGLHVVVGAASQHVHADDGDVCSVCAASSGDEACAAQSSALAAAPGSHVRATANGASLLPAARTSHLPRAPPAFSH